MTASMLDGFIAGLVVCPEPVPSSEWLPLVWGDDRLSPDDNAELVEAAPSLIGEWVEDLYRWDIGRSGLVGARGIAKVGRNAACPCGSGKKFKKCCGEN